MNTLVSWYYSILLLLDGYKLDHRRQYPFGTENVQSNLTARGTRLTGLKKTRWCGLQPFITRFFMKEMEAFFQGDIDKICAHYTSEVNAYLGPNSIGDQHLRDLHALGYLPLRICALPEGTAVPLRVPYFTIEATDPRFGWLVNYFETLMSTELWGMPTSATEIFRLRAIGKKYSDLTGSPEWFQDYQFHDFAERGMFGLDAAMLSGTGHLLGSKGSDTVPAISFIRQFYGTNPYVPIRPIWDNPDHGAYIPKDYVIAQSVAATEHSVMCAGGQDDELETYNRLLDLYPTGILSVVSDTWDLWNVVCNILPILKAKIISRQGKLVIRPDSGDPVKIICGDPDAPVGSAAWHGLIELLHQTFGGTKTDKGYIVLDEHIGAIYGDSINEDRAERILAGLAAKGFASCNIVFGVGSYTYQYVTRDTHNIALKATWCQIEGEGRNIYKRPKTDDGMKFSAKGRLAVLRDDQGELYLVNEATPEQEAASELRLIWEDGWYHVWESWDQIVARAFADPL